MEIQLNAVELLAFAPLREHQQQVSQARQRAEASLRKHVATFVTSLLKAHGHEDQLSRLDAGEVRPEFVDDGDAVAVRLVEIKAQPVELQECAE